LQPNQSSDSPYVKRPFVKDLKVKRSNVVQWLQYLKRHNPAYRDVNIDLDFASQLLEDGDLLDQVITIIDDHQDSSANLDTGPRMTVNYDIDSPLPASSVVQLRGIS
jgi:hypothetical protein